MQNNTTHVTMKMMAMIAYRIKGLAIRFNHSNRGPFP